MCVQLLPKYRCGHTIRHSIQRCAIAHDASTAPCPNPKSNHLEYLAPCGQASRCKAEVKARDKYDRAAAKRKAGDARQAQTFLSKQARREMVFDGKWPAHKQYSEEYFKDKERFEREKRRETAEEEQRAQTFRYQENSDWAKEEARRRQVDASCHIMESRQFPGPELGQKRVDRPVDSDEDQWWTDLEKR